MPKPTEEAVLTVRGQEFRDWETVEVVANLAEAYVQFRFTAAERDPLPLVNWTKLQFKPGDPCTVTLAGNLVVTGYIETRQVSYDANRHGVELIGKGKSAWVARSSVASKDGNFDKMTFAQVAMKVLAPYGMVPEVLGMLNPRPFEKLQSQPGETVWDFLERIARPRGIIMGSTQRGNFLLIGKWSPKIQSQLIEGVNILSCQCIITDKALFGQYNGIGQANDGDKGQGAAGSQLLAELPGTAKVRSMLETPAEQPVKDQAEVLERTMFERQWHESEIIEAHITTQGWLHDDKSIWYPGQHIYVKSPMAILDLILGAQQVTYRQSSQGGTTTELMLVLPWRLNATTAPIDTGNPNAIPAPTAGAVPPDAAIPRS